MGGFIKLEFFLSLFHPSGLFCPIKTILVLNKGQIDEEVIQCQHFMKKVDEYKGFTGVDKKWRFPREKLFVHSKLLSIALLAVSLLSRWFVKTIAMYFKGRPP